MANVNFLFRNALTYPYKRFCRCSIGDLFYILLRSLFHSKNAVYKIKMFAFILSVMDKNPGLKNLNLKKIHMLKCMY